MFRPPGSFVKDIMWEWDDHCVIDLPFFHVFRRYPEAHDAQGFVCGKMNNALIQPF